MKICVLLGGTSAEREVSLVSGAAMAQAAEELGHDVILVDPAFGRAMRLAEFHAVAPSEHAPSASELGVLASGSKLLESLQLDAVKNADVVMLGLHGVPGEDGVVQAVLELMGKPFTGSDSRSSALCIDKDHTKTILKAAGIAVPKGLTVKNVATRLDREAAWNQASAELGAKLVIKPNDQGSTVGLTILETSDPLEFYAALDLACQYSDKALVEEFVEGREVTVAVVGGTALPVVEIAPVGGFYDYHHKYTKGMTEYTCPARIPDEATLAMQADALKAFHACDCRGYARIDFRLRPDNSFSCLEINTLPGMTSLSLVPKAAMAAGLSFTELCKRIIRSALP